MGDRSGIEWTDATWNCIRARNLKTGKVGWHCEHATTGCEFCYAEGFNMRLGTGLPFKPGHRKDIEIFLSNDMLQLPLRWKKPRKIFAFSMTDPFADFVTDHMLDCIFAVMARCPQHTFQLLTKRAERMREYCVRWGDGPRGPLSNVWLGVSCERQEEADERIPQLLQTPAAVRFISAEPLLGPIDLTAIRHTDEDAEIRTNALTAEAWVENSDSASASANENDGVTKLDWVIAGGESGPHARPMSIQWVRELREQCAVARTKFFFKQWGEWRPAGLHRSEDPGRFAFGDYEHDRTAMVQVDGYPRQFTMFGACSVMQRVGKAKAGRLLDGVEHNEFPKVRA